ncbi:hypothetical protein MTR62_02300 [Novosphingobium sp. 1949]|uniref:Uncharacterized protein n=1 Tax=Novosphingobium organovorum TaxID=2930092 RepID=A0ABT0B9K1_9SPHN|nr:hypothetical protein [Novosphingobium organovorum]MCJ2181545.1 hypothetical protein [Novosphingobium organovorum]
MSGFTLFSSWRPTAPLALMLAGSVALPAAALAGPLHGTSEARKPVASVVVAEPRGTGVVGGAMPERALEGERSLDGAREPAAEPARPGRLPFAGLVGLLAAFAVSLAGMVRLSVRERGRAGAGRPFAAGP